MGADPNDEDLRALCSTLMVNACGRTLFLTGAPISSSLKWTDPDLCATLQQCYLDVRRSDQITRPIPEDIAPSWRFLPLEQAHLPTGLTQGSREDNSHTSDGDPTSHTSFLTASDVSFVSNSLSDNKDQQSQDSIPDTEEVLSQFYEHSFALHNEVLSSQIISAGSLVDVSICTNTDEFSMDLTSNGETNSQEQLVRSRLASGFLSDIKDVPDAAYLRSISPQTMTVNLVVGIITISQPRTIKTRKGGRTVELVEMLVGDNTGAGFGINIWLPCMQERKFPIQEAEDLRTSISELRSQDIVLARNVALSSFRGKVHGQSLRKGMTTVDLLYRNTVGMEDTRGAFNAQDLELSALLDSPILKAKKVKDFVMQFIGNGTGPLAVDNAAGARTKRKPLQALPSDTQ